MPPRGGYGGEKSSRQHGLPQQHAFDIVLRHSFARHQGCMAFGTNAGNPYLSENDGATWQTLSQTLLRVDALVWAD